LRSRARGCRALLLGYADRRTVRLVEALVEGGFPEPQRARAITTHRKAVPRSMSKCLFSRAAAPLTAAAAHPVCRLLIWDLEAAPSRFRTGCDKCSVPRTYVVTSVRYDVVMTHVVTSVRRYVVTGRAN
jgi:hypothetical protein